uniref:Uncharacterized protein n=1 Tax=Arundo donax TaxID=35708 RepID=A0A0A8YSB9_ARUDO
MARWPLGGGAGGGARLVPSTPRGMLQRVVATSPAAACVVEKATSTLRCSTADKIQQAGRDTVGAMLSVGVFDSVLRDALRMVHLFAHALTEVL